VSTRPPRPDESAWVADPLLPPPGSPPAVPGTAKPAWGLRRPTWIQLLVSGLIAGLGLLGAQALGRVDQDLRIMYTEYTLAATNLAHTSSDLLRYRVTIVRAIEAPSQKEFEHITASLPDQRARVQGAIERYAQASRHVRASGGHGAEQDLQALRGSLDAYFAAADRTASLLVRLWQATSPGEAAALRHQAELHAADNAGPKLVAASDALERLLAGVAEVGKDMREEGSGTIRTASLLLFVGSLLIAAVNLLA